MKTIIILVLALVVIFNFFTGIRDSFLNITEDQCFSASEMQRQANDNLGNWMVYAYSKNFRYKEIEATK
jgi:archaellum component FlaF (FlaF/FlaG flagellin family)